MLISIDISLRAYYGDGRNVTFEEFAGPLDTGDAEVVEVLCDRGAWTAALVVFARLGLEDYASENEPHEAFAAALKAKFEGIARWLGRQPPEAFRQMRERGLTTDIFFNMWIDDDQLDLTLPAALLSSCGALGLDIGMITND